MGANSSQSVQPATNATPSTNGKKNSSNSQATMSLNTMKGGMSPVQTPIPRQPSESVMQWATTAGIPSLQDGGKRKSRNKRKTHNKRKSQHKRKTNRRRNN